MSEHRCDGCGAPNASIRVHYGQGPDYTEFRLCERCSRRLSIEGEAPTFGPTVGELLGSLVGEHSTRSCPVCDTRFRSIRQTGRVGCAECYRTFHARIQQLLEQEGLSEGHAGRYPARLHSVKRLLVDRETLRQELSEALDREDYESAASLRDRMKSIEDATDGSH